MKKRYVKPFKIYGKLMITSINDVRIGNNVLIYI